ncbi:MAG: polysaccharide deacetylase family protein [Candidatus Bathyarchaeota archaeon]|nr:polysaccharide deacetylase family protein [Candidatus Bathyarchaeota archaeon]
MINDAGCIWGWERGILKNKGVMVLAGLLISLFAATIAIDYDNTPLAGFFAPPIPKQTYQPTIPSADEKVVCVVFDDGWKSQLDAVPILQNYGFTATFAIVTSYTSYPDYMSWSDIANIARGGMDIASHSVTHCDLSKVSAEQLTRELAGSQQTLRSRGYAADILVYPYGGASENQTVRDEVTKYYLAARGTVEGKFNLASPDRYSIASYDVYHDVDMEDFQRYLEGTGGASVTVLYYHQISDGTQDTAVSLATFKTQMQYLHDNGYRAESLSALLLKTEPPTA